MAFAISSTPKEGETNLPAPTAEQQKVLDRIEVQRERLRARRAALAQSRAVAQQRSTPGLGALAGVIDDSVALRAASFARQHPMAMAGMAAVGLLVGPRRLIRWAGVVIPVLMRFKR